VNQLQTLKSDFEKVGKIVGVLCQRERLKRKISHCDAEIFYARLSRGMEGFCRDKRLPATQYNRIKQLVDSRVSRPMYVSDLCLQPKRQKVGPLGRPASTISVGNGSRRDSFKGKSVDSVIVYGDQDRAISVDNQCLMHFLWQLWGLLFLVSFFFKVFEFKLL
jgi:hypothetical protein